MRFTLLTALVGLLAWLAGDMPAWAAHVEGVYWIEDSVYYLDLTLYNNDPDDEWPVIEVWVYPGGFDAQAPPNWYVGCTEGSVAWHASSQEYWLPPGEYLSGFTFQTYDLAQEYSYKIHGYGGNSHGYFTPEYIPWPAATGPAVLAVLALWAARRLRRS
jgi:hypothetical protein